MVAKKIDLKNNQRILDAGCGQGITSTYLAKKYNSDIWGITIVPFEVEKSKKRALKQGVFEKTNYQLMDYSNTNFSDNFFDAIYTIETLAHSYNIKNTLKEFLRILEPGGRVAFFEYTISEDGNFNNWEKKMLDLVANGSAMASLKNFRHDKFTKIMYEAGFVNVFEENITENAKPSFLRLHKISKYIYWFIKLFGLQKYFINTTAGYEYYKMVEKGLIRYCIFTGEKVI